MKLKKIFNYLICLFTFFFFISVLQSKAQQKDSLHISFFMDTYASLSTENNTISRPAFFVNYTSVNSLDLNFIGSTIHYRKNKFRTTAGLMAGRYSQLNLAAEEPWARYIYEANVGYKITKNHEIWLDAGVLPSHIGFENAAGIKNRTATRSMVAELSPYYETGLRLSFQPSAQWYFAILCLNGWQRITAPLNELGNNWGMQITYMPNPNWMINSSSYIGKVGFDGQNNSITRIYSNLYSTLTLHPRVSLLAGWDWGMQENSARQWQDFNVQFRYDFIHEQLAANLRIESFSDASRIFINTNRQDGANIGMATLNIDFMPFKKWWMLRSEINYLFANRPVLTVNDQFIDKQWSFYLISTLGIDFKK